LKKRRFGPLDEPFPRSAHVVFRSVSCPGLKTHRVPASRRRHIIGFGGLGVGAFTVR
jgi:hypothetical protein